jgi:hypothetical protein
LRFNQKWKEMKKLLFVAFSIACISCSAQNLSFNVRGGINLSDMTKVNDSDMKVGFQAGAGLDYAFTNNLSLQPALMIIQRGVKESDITVKPLYLELPIDLAYKFDLQNNMKFFVNAGPYFAYGLSGTAKEGGLSVDLFGDKTGALDWNRFDAGVGIGCGLEFTKFIISLKQEFGLTKVVDGGGKNETTALSVAYKF